MQMSELRENHVLVVRIFSRAGPNYCCCVNGILIQRFVITKAIS